MKTNPQGRPVRWPVALILGAALVAGAFGAPVNRAEFIDAQTTPPLVDVETFPLQPNQHNLRTLTARARAYPYRCSFGGKLLPRQRVVAVCNLPRGVAGETLTPMPIVQVATGSVVIDSSLVAIEQTARRVRITLHNASDRLEPLAATVDVY